MDKYLAGLVNLTDIPDALYIADLRVEKTAVAEANRKEVPMIAICDSNVDPTKVDFPIPANDDAVNAIRLIADLMTQAINEGKAEFEKNKAAVKDVPMTHQSSTSAPLQKAVAPKVQADKSVKKERLAIRKEEAV